MTPDGWLTLSDLTVRTGLSWEALRKRRQRGRFPVPDGRAGQVPLWREGTILRWEQEQRLRWEQQA